MLVDDGTQIASPPWDPPPPPGLLQGRLPPPRPPPLLAVARWTDALTFPGPKPARLRASRTWVAVIDCGLKRASQSLIPSSRCLRPFPPWVRFHTGHCPPSTVHCPGHTPPAPREQPKIDRLACPTPDSLQKPSWKATSAPRNDLVSAILRPWPGTLSLPVIPCLPLPLCVVGSLSVVHPSESQGHPIANHRPPRFPNIRPTTRSPTTPRAAFLPKIRRTRSVVTRHPGPASPPPLISPDTTLPVASQFIPSPAQSTGHEGPPALLSSTLANPNASLWRTLLSTSPPRTIPAGSRCHPWLRCAALKCPPPSAAIRTRMGTPVSDPPRP